ncbi:FAD/NAD(P)-binding domain-containing protein [Sparassis crispa]|uniref:FAD/NAD(P)-binding domain-containing protein n=1 Tax=Sparassis crispa TaxID=139825 RepID=A0A401GSX6_9APHY|nr:FAD/NAD(P)-binding domain-containing protein [Sparassis crispa]GBE85351.1 FAD/NAD(P)-binding domain-containing protein [Sparassis crispa]
MSKKNDTQKNVVIVGGGFIGSAAARELSQKLDPARYKLILINKRPYYVHLIAGARVTVADEPGLDDRSLIPYDKLFVNGNGSFLRGNVTAIEESAPGKGGVVVLDDGERVPYAALLLASGSSWSGAINFPESDDEVREHIAEWRKKYAAAHDIFLVGGGAVGIETAGEIKDAFPNKKVTIVQSGSMLLNSTYPDKFRKNIERRVRQRGVNIIFNEFVDEFPAPGAVGVRTRSGKEFLTADLVVPTFGARPNAGFVASLGSDVLTDAGFVKIKPTLEVVGHPGVFAAGDIMDWKEQKQAGKAPAHIGVAVPNLLSFLAGQPQNKAYKGSIEMVVIPIGKYHGAGYFDVLWGISVGNWVTSILKGRELFVGKARTDRGYPA